MKKSTSRVVLRAILLLLLAVILALPPTSRATASLVARWDLDDGSGTTVTSQYGSILGTIEGTSYVSWGKDGPPQTYLVGWQGADEHLDFSSTTNAVNFGTSSVLNPEHVRVGFWAKANGNHASQILVSKWGVAASDQSWEFGFAGTDRGLFFRTRAAADKFAGLDAPNRYTPAAFNDGEWHYIMGLYDGTAASLFVDGQLIQTVAQTGLVNDSSSTNLLMGHRPHTSAEPFTGRIGGPLVIANNYVGGIAAQWDIDEGTGTSLNPAIGTITGTLETGVTWEAGGPPDWARPGNALKFNANTSQAVNLGNSSDLNPENITVAFWAKADGSHNKQILMSKWAESISDGQSWEFGFNQPGNLWFRTRTNSGEVFAGKDVADPFSVTEFNDGQWHQIVGTHDGQTSSLYVDGVLIESLGNLGGIRDSGGNTDLLVGRRPYTALSSREPFSGWIGGPILIYDRALTASEITALMVPEPSSGALLAVGLLFLVPGCRRKRR